MEKKSVYLMFVDPKFGNQGHNKYYNAFPLGDGTFKVEYGRVGSSPQTKIYPISKWDNQINSKIKKGYVDISENMTEFIENSKVEKDNDIDKFSLINNLSVRNIVKRLFEFANNTIQTAYNVQSNVVTQAMIDKAQNIIDDLKVNLENYTLEEINQKLVGLFTVIPRKMQNVSDFLVHNLDKDEEVKVLDREQSLLDTMAGQVYKPKININKEKSNLTSNTSILDDMGIFMEEVTEEDITKIKNAMGDCADKFYKAWKVTNYETEKAYNEFVTENNIGNIRLLCHGSRNRNWFNIIKMGLKIRPVGAGYNGSMFGDGLYFSNPDKFYGGVRKSIGYTSLGGYWTREYDNCGFIAFFDVALGEGYDIYSFDSKWYQLNLNMLHSLKPNAYHCFAHGGTGMLKNDEIIVYDTRQMTIRYLVEIR